MYTRRVYYHRRKDHRGEFKPKPGQNAFAPTNANLATKARRRPAWKTQQLRHQIAMSAAGSPNVQLPDYFSWDDPSAVSVLRMASTIPPQNYMSPVMNQYLCGCCWACASAQMLSDRYSIHGQMNNPCLGPTYVLSCMSQKEYPDSQGCSGGVPYDAGLFMSSAGTVSEACQGFEWCSQNPECTTAMPPDEVHLNSHIPSAEPGSCLQMVYDANGDKVQTTKTSPTTKNVGSVSTIYQVDSSSIESLSGAEEIQLELFANGPVVCTYFVYGDFYTGALDSSSMFASTGGIYIHGDPGYPKDLTGQSQPASEVLMGGHAVVCVGWGMGKAGSYGTIPYWIVRNSWGPEWGENGYFKIAFSQTLPNGKKINTDVGFDTQITSKGMTLGGATVWMPAITSLIPPVNTAAKVLASKPTVTPKPVRPDSCKDATLTDVTCPSECSFCSNGTSCSSSDSSSTPSDMTKSKTSARDRTLIYVLSAVGLSLIAALIVVTVVFVQNKNKKQRRAQISSQSAAVESAYELQSPNTTRSTGTNFDSLFDE